jgi:hypothetical protein
LAKRRTVLLKEALLKEVFLKEVQFCFLKKFCGKKYGFAERSTVLLKEVHVVAGPAQPYKYFALYFQT